MAQKRSEPQIVRLLSRKVAELTAMIERLNLVEYMRYLDKPHRVFRLNFFAGLARGFGMAIGFTLLTVLVVFLLQKIAASNIPGISEFMVELIRAVQKKL